MQRVEKSSGMQWSLSFPSQINFRPHGHLICTPISLLAGTAYLLHLKDATSKTLHNDALRSIFSVQKVHEMMQVSHQFYAEVFSKRGLPLMIQEMYPWIPKTNFSLKEAAGLIFVDGLSEAHDPGAAPSHDEVKKKDEDHLVLKSLFALLKEELEDSKDHSAKAAIIVTAKGHTVCFLCSESGDLFLFDSLPATLLCLPSAMIQQQLMLQFGVSGTGAHETEYSALIMRRVQE